VGFHDAHEDIEALRLPLTGQQQHRISLADARTHPEQNVELAPLILPRLALQLRKQGIRVRSVVVVHGGGLNQTDSRCGIGCQSFIDWVQVAPYLALASRA
jgi:hypothetical protein